MQRERLTDSSLMLKVQKIYSLLLCINVHQDFIFHLELMYPTGLIHSFVTDSHPRLHVFLLRDGAGSVFCSLNLNGGQDLSHTVEKWCYETAH